MSEGLLALGIEDLGLELSPSNIADLELFLQEMGRWNQVHNLTAIEGEKDSIRLHLIDSIAVLPVLKRYLKGSSPKIADLGSGGGLPAIPIAIVQPDWHLSFRRQRAWPSLQIPSHRALRKATTDPKNVRDL